MKIRTNNHERLTLTWEELTDKERGEFDYSGAPDSTFVRYRGWSYDLGQFMLAPDSLAPWQGIHGDSFFSGIVIRFVDDADTVIMGTYIA